MKDYWNSINYFKPKEFYSPDLQEDHMNPKLIYALDYVRQQMEVPLHVNSGYRTPEHNKKVKGNLFSQHLQGNAADIHCPTEEFQDQVEYWFLDWMGNENCGIGRYNNFIHLDVREEENARWDERTKP